MYIDIIFALLVLATFIHGLMNGFLTTLFGIGKYFVALFASILYFPDFAKWLDTLPLIGGSPKLQLLLFFIFNLIIIALVFSLLDKAFRNTFLNKGIIFRPLGGLLEAFIFILLLTILNYFLVENQYFNLSSIPQFAGSYVEAVYNYVSSLAPSILSNVQELLAQ